MCTVGKISKHISFVSLHIYIRMIFTLKSGSFLRVFLEIYIFFYHTISVDVSKGLSISAQVKRRCLNCLTSHTLCSYDFLTIFCYILISTLILSYFYKNWLLSTDGTREYLMILQTIIALPFPIWSFNLLWFAVKMSFLESGNFTRWDSELWMNSH